ncbi:MAG: hypothetical protein KDI36_03770 [Pseudomonadales bacterium]|nr:hypothetical protein [Pseudomonadales bacterium]
MDIVAVISLSVSVLALAGAIIALGMAWTHRRKDRVPVMDQTYRQSEYFPTMASMLSDGALVWQRLIVECDDIGADIPATRLTDQQKEAMGGWLLQLKDFCRSSRQTIEQSYTLLNTEARKLSATDLDLQFPEMERYNREMKSNINVISEQLSHLRCVVNGQENFGDRPLKITLHKPQGIPHFLKVRKKIAELQARRKGIARQSPQPAAS